MFWMFIGLGVIVMAVIGGFIGNSLGYQSGVNDHWIAKWQPDSERGKAARSRLEYYSRYTV